MLSILPFCCNGNLNQTRLVSDYEISRMSSMMSRSLKYKVLPRGKVPS